MTLRSVHAPPRRRPARLAYRPCLEGLEDRVTPATLLGLSTAGNLVRFDSTTPATTSSTAVTNLNFGEVVLGIDFRPSNGLLYGITSQNHLITINVVSGAASVVATLAADPTDSTNPFTALSGTAFGVDFNPVSDRLRVVSTSGQNLRINPDNGLVSTDADLNPGTPRLVASAYSNNFAGATATTLYGIDSNADTLVIQNPPNNGTITAVSAGLGFDTSDLAGFDIFTTGGPTRSNTAFASLTAPAGSSSQLFTIDLTTGTATLVGSIGGGIPLTGLAVVPAGTLNFHLESYGVNENGGTATITVTRSGGSLGAVNVDFAIASGTATAGADFTSATGTLMWADGDGNPRTFTVSILDDQLAEGYETVSLSLSNATGGAVIGPRGSALLTIRDNESPVMLLYGITSGNTLVEFTPDSPNVPRRTTPVTNLKTGDVIEGIDFRPANGKLFALVVNGIASRLVTIDPMTGAATPVANLAVDPADTTNPFTALAGVDFGFDFNPTNDRIRIVSDADENLAVNPDNGLVTTQTTITGGTPNVVGSAYTNSFAGAGSTLLYAIDSGTDSLYTQNPPANGVLALVGALGFDTAGQVGFDISPAGNQAFATLTPPAATNSALFNVNLTTGAATRIGTILAGATLNGLAAQTLNEVNFSDNERVVNRLFRDLLGRNAEDSARLGFAAQLSSGVSREALAKQILGSEEYRGRVVEDLYVRLLHRASDAGGKAGFVAALGGGMTAEQVMAVMVGSDEYFTLHGSSSAGFLAAAYQDLFGRPIDPIGQADLAAALGAGATRQQVAALLLASDEYLNLRVTGFYRLFLLREPDPAGLASHVARLKMGVSSTDEAAVFLGSAEYAGRDV
jgi:hypothetical protein